jgi:hypothetical protein
MAFRYHLCVPIERTIRQQSCANVDRSGSLTVICTFHQVILEKGTSMQANKPIGRRDWVVPARSGDAMQRETSPAFTSLELLLIRRAAHP